MESTAEVVGDRPNPSKRSLGETAENGVADLAKSDGRAAKHAKLEDTASTTSEGALSASTGRRKGVAPIKQE